MAHRFTAEVIDSPRIAYIDRSASFIKRNEAEFQTIIDTGKNSEEEPVSEHDLQTYVLILEDADLINGEYQRVRVTAPNVIMDDKLTIESGKPDANQYTPVFNGVSAWQLCHGPKYAVPATYRNDEWMHVKLVYAGTRADVYIDSDEPLLRVNNLKREAKGGFVGINAANFRPLISRT